MLWDSLIVLVGTAVYAVGLYYFVEPSNTAPGGVSGIALLVNYVTGFPVGIASALINAPLLILGLVFLGKEFILKTLLFGRLLYGHLRLYPHPAPLPLL